MHALLAFEINKVVVGIFRKKFKSDYITVQEKLRTLPDKVSHPYKVSLVVYNSAQLPVTHHAVMGISM